MPDFGPTHVLLLTASIKQQNSCGMQFFISHCMLALKIYLSALFRYLCYVLPFNRIIQMSLLSMNFRWNCGQKLIWIFFLFMYPVDSLLSSVHAVTYLLGSRHRGNIMVRLVLVKQHVSIGNCTIFVNSVENWRIFTCSHIVMFQKQCTVHTSLLLTAHRK